MKKSTVTQTAFAIVGGLFPWSCVCPTAEQPAAEAAMNEFQQMILGHQYAPVMPARSDYVPGTLIDKAATGGPIIAAGHQEVFPSGAPVQSGAALWFRDWRRQSTETSSIDFVASLTGKSSQEVAAAIERTGTSGIRVAAGSAEIRSISKLAAMRSIPLMGPLVRELLGHSSMIMESLLVTGLRIDFEDSQSTDSSLGVQFLDEVLGADLRQFFIQTTDGVLQGEAALCIGYRTVSFANGHSDSFVDAGQYRLEIHSDMLGVDVKAYAVLKNGEEKLLRQDIGDNDSPEWMILDARFFDSIGIALGETVTIRVQVTKGNGTRPWVRLTWEPVAGEPTVEHFEQANQERGSFELSKFQVRRWWQET